MLLEAAAYDTPIVATDAGGTREIVGDEFPLCPVDDVDAIAARLEIVLNALEEGIVGENMFPLSRCVSETWRIWTDLVDAQSSQTG